MQIRTVTEDYIKDLLDKGIREDGRELTSYRNISIRKGVIPSAEGSAEVMLGNTKVLAGVKLGIGEPMPDKPEEGNLMTNAELLPIASESYETGPPSPESIELARVVDRGIRAANVVDPKSLFIEKDKVWSLFVDVYILNYDGNLFDAGTLAAVSALATARMPKYENEVVIREGNLGKLRTENIVTSCTFAKIGKKLILDPDSNEEEFMNGRITIANDENSIRAMQKGLSGSFSPKELESLMDVTFDKSKELRRQIIQLGE
jgi:exosome complex component RRP42